jgi:hypothetical protein
MRLRHDTPELKQNRAPCYYGGNWAPLPHTPTSAGLNTLLVITSVMVVICMERAGVLAGPALWREVTESVAILLETDRPVKVDAAIYYLDTLVPLNTATIMTSIRAGHRLFIHLIQVHGQFPTDTFLGYDLLFRVEKFINNLGSLGLKTNMKIPLRTMAFPTLRFSSPLLQLQLFYMHLVEFSQKG